MEDITRKPNNVNLPNKGEAWWAPAIEIFSEVSTWIVAPIVLALIVGKSLDNHFNTKPIIFLSLIAFSFLVSSFGIFKVIGRYMKKIKDLGEDKKENN